MKIGKCIGMGRTANVYEYGRDQVVKLFHKGMSMGSEASNTKIINELGLPSPKVFGTVEIEGKEGIIFERLDGSTMTKSIENNKESIEKHAKLLAKLQVGINEITVNHPSNIVQEISYRINYVKGIEEEKKKEAIHLLEQLLEKREICHYDFHPDNIIMTPNGPKIIDWSNVLVGNSLIDVTRTSLILCSEALPPGLSIEWLSDKELRQYFYKIYINEYLNIRKIEETELNPCFLPLAIARLGEGIKEEETYLLNIINKKTS